MPTGKGGNEHRCTHKSQGKTYSLFASCNPRLMRATSGHRSIHLFSLTLHLLFSPFIPPILIGSKGDVLRKTCKQNYFRCAEVGREMHGWEWGYTKTRQNLDGSLTRQPLNLQGRTSCFESQMAAAPPNPFIASPRHLKSQKSATRLA